MSYVVAQPPAIAAAATELAGIGSALSEATAAAAGPTTAILSAAADEVSTAIAQLLGTFGAEYQGISTQLAAFHAQITQRLATVANYYINAEEINNAALLEEATARLYSPNSPPTVPAVFNDYVAIAMGGTGTPIPSTSYLDAVNTLYIQHIAPGAIAKALFTPEQLYPITGVKSLPFQTSVQEGLKILDISIWNEINAGNHVTVFGYSQSAVIASLEMQHFISLGPNAPDPSQINFILTGNEMNPNGGILARIPGLNVASLGLPFYGATPDNPYYTTTYTLEYDGFADFPRYPLNVLSDVNAVFGILTVHRTYPDLTPEQIASATLLPTEGPTTGTYYMIRTENLPLLDPVRAIPVIGEPLAALVQPDLKVLVNLGYGDPNYGYSTSPANVPTPFGLFPDVSLQVVADALVAGTHQGINDFGAALPTALSTTPQIAPLEFPPYVQSVLPPAPPPMPATPINIANTLASVVSTGYSVLLPTADIGLGFVTSLPAYNLTLFLSQLAQGDLRAAIELPLAATFGLGALGGMIEFIAVMEAAAEIAQDLQSLYL
ncbi:putative PPE family protein PPE42 [Mycobacterium marinum]|uniref:PE family protein n=1 Tax=Mycobacterium marinum TaxID=1781 RepID=UPI00045FBA02|nr:PE-PPE domain-containing protein [Mycobacterium marinum]AXN42294.1 putative PPE family protein PPE42 [Mycobacterium marinum]RFZ13954.1 putative PPE family protein PPE42 [Mycobacterium marinum]CDM74483.1 PE family protein [Mycobacterium marinum E11]